jgi:small subunit ribosomal protein S11
MAKPNKGAAPRKKVKKTVVDGVAHIHASFNNTIVTITERINSPTCSKSTDG